MRGSLKSLCGVKTVSYGIYLKLRFQPYDANVLTLRLPTRTSDNPVSPRAIILLAEPKVVKATTRSAKPRRSVLFVPNDVLAIHRQTAPQMLAKTWR